MTNHHNPQWGLLIYLSDQIPIPQADMQPITITSTTTRRTCHKNHLIVTVVQFREKLVERNDHPCAALPIGGCCTILVTTRPLLFVKTRLKASSSTLSTSCLRGPPSHQGGSPWQTLRETPAQHCQNYSVVHNGCFRIVLWTRAIPDKTQTCTGSDLAWCGIRALSRRKMEAKRTGSSNWPNTQSRLLMLLSRSKMILQVMWNWYGEWCKWWRCNVDDNFEPILEEATCECQWRSCRCH